MYRSGEEVKLNLGCGIRLIEGFQNHDKCEHPPHAIAVWDLEEIPWIWMDGQCSYVRAYDVFEHLRPWKVQVHEWLGECWRILKHRGTLEMRLPAHDREWSYRDPTHHRVFTHESFDYFCPGCPSRLHEEFGFYYWGNYGKWWEKLAVYRDEGDWLFRLRKI